MASNKLHYGKSEVLSSENKFCYNTILKRLKCCYRWEVQNFGDFLDRNYEISSPIFCDEQTDAKWRIMIFPAHDYPKGTHLAMNLLKMCLDGICHGVKYKISAVVEDTIVLQTREKIFRNYLDFDTCLIISHDELIKKKILRSNNLCILCEMDILFGENLKHDDENNCNNVFFGKFMTTDKVNNLAAASSAESNHSTKDEFFDSAAEVCSNLNSLIKQKDICVEEDVVKDTLSCLSEDLNSLYVGKQFCDFWLNVNGIDVPCHRAILSSRSSYFRKACEESKCKKMTINGIRNDIFEVVLHYIYTGQVPVLTFDLALDLLTAAKMFCLNHLQQLVLEFLKIHENTNNAIEVLQVSENLKL